MASIIGLNEGLGGRLAGCFIIIGLASCLAVAVGLAAVAAAAAAADLDPGLPADRTAGRTEDLMVAGLATGLVAHDGAGGRPGCVAGGVAVGG